MVVHTVGSGGRGWKRRRMHVVSDDATSTTMVAAAMGLMFLGGSYLWMGEGRWEE